MGGAPSPTSIAHFPSRLHAFVWRNWPLVPIVRMAKVVKAKSSDIRRIGSALGLESPPEISRDQWRRSYITIIKRNWHLLSYYQLLELLDWTPAQMAFTLREDDFLYVKLGNLKPHCEPLYYQPPDEKVLQREQEIAKVVSEEFQVQSQRSVDPLFGFVRRLSKPARPQPQTGGTGQLRFCYSYFALYGDPLLDTGVDPYPEGYLARLAQAGVNGVWLQAVLQKLAPFPWAPELSANYERRLKNLRLLINRANRHGIRVFLYLNEPRSMPLSFFSRHPELKGSVEGEFGSLCTSNPEVRKYLVDSVAAICRSVPGLGGFFTITASENFTHCWSHGAGDSCPRCSKRPPSEVIAEVNRLLVEGIQRSDDRVQLIAWDWGWNDEWAKDIIHQLPSEVALMSVSEWSLPIERGGVKSDVGEYSISAIGPGPRARRHWEWAKQRGLKTFAKIQAGNTWELSAVPYIPALENVARHGEQLSSLGIDGLMLGWTLGGYPSPNLEAVGTALATGSAQQAMRQVAERRFGPACAFAALEAWRGFSSAFQQFPYHIGVLYSGPQQLGPANLLWAEPTGFRASMVGFPYDDLDSWRSIYPPDVFIRQFDLVADGFEQTLAKFKLAIQEKEALISETQQRSIEEEFTIAEACAIHFRSVANQSRFILACRGLSPSHSPETVSSNLSVVSTMLHREIALARRQHQLQTLDSRIGFEASNQYYYIPIDLMEKTLNCRNLLNHFGVSPGI
jgi:hypothetical protein